MNQAFLRTPWEYCKAVFSLAPVASNAAQNGASIDRSGYQSLIADIVYLCSGAPTGGALTAQLQTSSDNSTWVNYGTAVTTNLATTAAGGVLSLPMHISGAQQYVRVVTSAAPTGGASPIVTASQSVRLFGADLDPAV